MAKIKPDELYTIWVYIPTYTPKKLLFCHFDSVKIFLRHLVLLSKALKIEIDTLSESANQRTLHVGGSITVRLGSYLTDLDLVDKVSLFGKIQSS